MKHLLIDFENIQPQNLDNLPTEDTHIWLFLGAVHKNLPIELVQSLSRFGGRVHLVRLEKVGKNALDFYLSYYLGRITAVDKQAIISILSRDGGYDLLVNHVLKTSQAQKIVRVSEINQIAQSLTLNPTPLKTEPQNHKPILPFFQAALLGLRQPNAVRPNNLPDLKIHLQRGLQKLLQEQTEQEQHITIQNIINKLKQQTFIQVNETNQAITYQMESKHFWERIKIALLNQRPKTTDEFQAVVEHRAKALTMNITAQHISAFFNHLAQAGILRMTSGKIEYAPFPQPKPQPKQPPINKSKKYQPDTATLQKIVEAISPTKSNRPNKIKSLKNMIKALSKSTDEEMECLFQYLHEKKYIQTFENNEKVEYTQLLEPKTTKYQPNPSILKKVIAAVFVDKSKRAQKTSSLKNVIKSHAKCSDQETEQLFQYLQDKKHIQVNDNKIIYLK